MPQLPDRPIAHKLTRMNMLVSGVALLLACSAFIGYDLITFRQGAVRNLAIQAQIIGVNSVSALLFNDPRAANDTVSALNASPNILSAGVYTLDGRPFAQYQRNANVKLPTSPAIPPGETEAHRFQGEKLELSRMILFQGKPVGIVYMQSDRSGVNTRLERYVLIAAMVWAVSILCALLVSSVFRSGIALPITQLAETARVVSREKNFSVRAAPTSERGEIAMLIEAFNEMLKEIQERDERLRKAREELEQRVLERTAQLEVANHELESFSYSVSHDLRAPLRSIDGFSQALLEDCADKLDDNGKDCLNRVRSASQRMALLIDDLLNLARVARSEVRREKVDLTAVAKAVAKELQQGEPGRQVEFVIGEGLNAEGDSLLLRLALQNLLGNAWKYTSRHDCGRIEFGLDQNGAHPVYFVRDDGAGFDPRYKNRLFGVFQRLHGAGEFPGTGVGLATVQKIVRRHGGEIWAEGAIEKGATFYFSLLQANRHLGEAT
jgi:signal transduction histidine kinase